MSVWLVIWILLALLAAAAVTSIWMSRDQEITPSPPKPSAAPRMAAREFRTVVLSDAFQPETAPLWEPQIEVLRMIGDAGASGVELEMLRPAHRRLAEGYPELFEGSDLESWLEAMERAELVSWKESNVTLTAAGRAFLRCRLAVTV